MGRTLDIHVACGSPSVTAPPDISIPITRIGHGSSSSSSSASSSQQQQQQHQPDVSTPKTASPSVYELPLTPAPRSHRSATADAIPRLDLLTAPHRDFSSIFEVPPTPPGVHPAAGKHVKVREISVGCSKPSQPHPIQQEQAGNGSKESVRVIQVVTAGDQEPYSDRDNEDDVPAVDIVIKNAPPPPPKDIDFSLFLMRNARSRQQLRESLKREEAGKREVVEHAEEDLEALLRRWEAAQWEEEAAARAREEEVARSASAIVQPMFPSLKDLPLLNYINSEGKIEPQTEVDTDVSVFAVYDRLKKVQYIGVSKNVKNAMRKIMGRKPGFCYYYKIYNLPRVESLPQPHSLKQRWTEELGNAPPGNADAMQRKQWEQPVDAAATAEKGTAPLAAAIQKAKSLIQVMVDRGLKEEMVYDPALMDFGRCDVLETTTPADAPKGKHTVIKTPYGGSIEYYICYNDKSKTTDGWKYDVSINKDSEETRHLVTCGDGCPETLTDDGFLELVIAFLLHKGIPRSKELRTIGFSMNNFSTADFIQKFDDFKPWCPSS